MSIGTIDKYILLKHLGSGAFGKVFLAFDQALNASKAIKVIDVPNAYEVKQKLEEAQILHKCKHKNIVKINEANVFYINDKPNVVIDMEYLPLGNLEVQSLNSAISIHNAIRIIIDCLFGLEHAHLNGTLHRDIKPANIMLCNYGAKLSDFGLATVLGESITGSPQGYTTHLPPEFFSDNITTELTDIYAVGITLFRACNYISNWNSVIAKLIAPIKKIQTRKLISSIGYASFIPLNLKKIINKACAVLPDKRFQSAIAFRDALMKLSPNIDWKPTSPLSFKGYCANTKDNYSCEMITKRKTFLVEVKKNNRRQLTSCQHFCNYNDASNYCHNFIAFINNNKRFIMVKYYRNQLINNNNQRGKNAKFITN